MAILLNLYVNNVKKVTFQRLPVFNFDLFPFLTYTLIIHSTAFPLPCRLTIYYLKKLMIPILNLSSKYGVQSFKPSAVFEIWLVANFFVKESNGAINKQCLRQPNLKYPSFQARQLVNLDRPPFRTQLMLNSSSTGSIIIKEVID